MRRALVGSLVLVLGSVVGSAEVQARSVEVVPATIDPTGTTDVTGPINEFIASVPDGSSVVFPAGARYRVEGSVLVENRRDLVIEGQGATFFATTEGDRGRAHWKIQLSSNIVVRAVNVIGANEGAGVHGVFDVDREAQHAFSVQGSDRITLDGVSATDVYGDFVYVDKHAGVPATNIVVQGSRFSGSGRQGISVSSGEDVYITGNDIREVRRSVFDFEPYAERLAIRRIHIVGNTIGPARFYFVSSAGRAATVEDIEIRGNQLSGMLPSVVIDGHPQALRRRFTVVDNTTDQPTNHPVFSFQWVEGATISGNSVPFESQKDGFEIFAVKSVTSCGIVIGANNFNGATPLQTDGYPCPEAAAPPVPDPGPGGAGTASDETATGAPGAGQAGPPAGEAAPPADAGVPPSDVAVPAVDGAAAPTAAPPGGLAPAEGPLIEVDDGGAGRASASTTVAALVAAAAILGVARFGARVRRTLADVAVPIEPQVVPVDPIDDDLERWYELSGPASGR